MEERRDKKMKAERVRRIELPARQIERTREAYRRLLPEREDPKEREKIPESQQAYAENQSEKMAQTAGRKVAELSYRRGQRALKAAYRERQKRTAAERTGKTLDESETSKYQSPHMKKREDAWYYQDTAITVSRKNGKEDRQNLKRRKEAGSKAEQIHQRAKEPQRFQTGYGMPENSGFSGSPASGNRKQNSAVGRRPAEKKGESPKVARRAVSAGKHLAKIEDPKEAKVMPRGYGEPYPRDIAAVRSSTIRSMNPGARAYKTRYYQQKLHKNAAVTQRVMRIFQKTGEIFKKILNLKNMFLAGGFLVLMLLVGVTFMGVICSSPFGIFLQKGDGDDNLRQILQDIGQEYEAEIEAVRNSRDFDAQEITGSRSSWKDVLAVYAVQSGGNKNLTRFDSEDRESLRDLYFAMNPWEWEIVSYESAVQETLIDEAGQESQAETVITQEKLCIRFMGITAQAMAESKGFSSFQMEELGEMLLPENQYLWNDAFYGITGGDSAIVQIAASQIGNVGGDPYWSWYGFTAHVDWCACFVSWCANECGYLDTGIMPKFASCREGVAWFKERGGWLPAGEVPAAGSLIFFDWDLDGSPEHVGIVEKIEGNSIYTIEGNAGNTCRELQYLLTNVNILGYGVVQNGSLM